MEVEIQNRVVIKSGEAHFFETGGARVEVSVTDCAAFPTAVFAYQSGAPLLRMVAFLWAPVGLLVPGLACRALDQDLALQAA